MFRPWKFIPCCSSGAEETAPLSSTHSTAAFQHNVTVSRPLNELQSATTFHSSLIIKKKLIKEPFDLVFLDNDAGGHRDYHHPGLALGSFLGSSTLRLVVICVHSSLEKACQVSQQSHTFCQRASTGGSG